MEYLAGNWFVVGASGDGWFVPQHPAASTSGDDRHATAPMGAQYHGWKFAGALCPRPVAKATIGGLYLGARQLDLYGQPARVCQPGAGGRWARRALTINAGTLNNITTSEAAFVADGRIMVGVDGRGYLTMNGGTLTGTALTVAGENVTTGNGTSLLDLRGSSTLTVNGAHPHFSRRLRIEGPNVNFSSSRQLAVDRHEFLHGRHYQRHGALAAQSYDVRSENLVDGTLEHRIQRSRLPRAIPLLRLGPNGRCSTSTASRTMPSMANSPMWAPTVRSQSPALTRLIRPPWVTGYKVSKRTSGGQHAARALLRASADPDCQSRDRRHEHSQPL